MVNPIYPTRSFIRFQAKSQLAADMSRQQVMTFVSQENAGSRMDLALPKDSQDLTKPAALIHEHHSNEPSVAVELDEVLFKEISSLAFHPDQHPEIYQPCTSRDQARAIEQAIATEIVETYKQIKVNETKPSIQALNSLL